MDLFATLTSTPVQQIPVRHRDPAWMSRSKRGLDRTSRSPSLDILEGMTDSEAKDLILRSAGIRTDFVTGGASAKTKEDDDTSPRRHFDRFVGEPATYHDLPLEIRIEIWSWALVDYEHPSHLWAIQETDDAPGMYVYPVCRYADDETNYTQRRLDPINKVLRMDAAATQAVYRRFKPLSIGFPWHRVQDLFPRRKPDPRRIWCNRQCIKRGCPLDHEPQCQCWIIWVDPVNDVFLLPGTSSTADFQKCLDPYRQDLQFCRLHGETKIRGIEVVQNVLISSEAFMYKTVWGEPVPPSVSSMYDGIDRPSHSAEDLANNRADVLRLPSLKRVFLLANEDMWNSVNHFSHWPYALRSFMYLSGEDNRGHRDWLEEMAFTNIMKDEPSGRTESVRRSDAPGQRGRSIEWNLEFKEVEKVEQPRDFAAWWAPFAAKGVTYQFMLWDENVRRKNLGGVRVMFGRDFRLRPDPWTHRGHAQARGR